MYIYIYIYHIYIYVIHVIHSLIMSQYHRLCLCVSVCVCVHEREWVSELASEWESILLSEWESDLMKRTHIWRYIYIWHGSLSCVYGRCFFEMSPFHGSLSHIWSITHTLSLCHNIIVCVYVYLKEAPAYFHGSRAPICHPFLICISILPHPHPNTIIIEKIWESRFHVLSRIFFSYFQKIWDHMFSNNKIQSSSFCSLSKKHIRHQKNHFSDDECIFFSSSEKREKAVKGSCAPISRNSCADWYHRWIKMKGLRLRYSPASKIGFSYGVLPLHLCPALVFIDITVEYGRIL